MNIDIDHLTRKFGRTQAVAGVDLQVGPGVFGLLGPNGAGKTSLLRMMATVLQPSSGSLQLLGRNPASYGPRREIRRRLGYLPQNLGYYPGFTVVEFVEYFALLKEMPPARIPAAVAAAVEGSSSGTGPSPSCAPSRVGCCAGSGSPRPSSTTRSCCCWTSRPQGLTPNSGCSFGLCSEIWAKKPRWS